MIFLVASTLLHKLGMSVKDSRIAALGLAFGTAGDFMLGGSHESIVFGAIAFGLGHMAYLVSLELKNWSSQGSGRAFKDCTTPASFLPAPASRNP